MTAEEMFSDLDYKCVFEDADTIIYDNDGVFVVTFDKVLEEYKLKSINEINVYLHKAITKQMEELKWL